MSLQFLRRAWVFSVAALFIIAVGAPLAWGQHTEGTVNVTVTDPQGAVVPGAEVRLVDPASGDTRVGKTSNGGTYSFPNLSVGNYRLEVNSTGFAAQQVPNVVVQATKTTDIRIELVVGTQVQTVQVESATPVLETSNNAIGSVIDP
ncbi:MAG TPA: carboxypeptidase-like regulatory domain-containing protein, partial [Terriglobales bacterium]|nr:carboxypeptidase-like regulatory domain-containing protein [Terriglobales bacterium]